MDDELKRDLEALRVLALEVAHSASNEDLRCVIADLTAECKALRFALQHLVHNVKATGKRLDLGLALKAAEYVLKD